MRDFKEHFEKYIFYGLDGCWYWIGTGQNEGYGVVYKDQKPKLAHRMSFELYKHAIPSGMIVMHSCDNRKCVNPDHLSLGTNKDNMQDMIKKGRKVIGKRRQPDRRITEDDAREIKRMYAEGVPPKEISRIKNMIHSTVESICYNVSWKHIKINHDERI